MSDENSVIELAMEGLAEEIGESEEGEQREPAEAPGESPETEEPEEKPEDDPETKDEPQEWTPEKLEEAKTSLAEEQQKLLDERTQLNASWKQYRKSMESYKSRNARQQTEHARFEQHRKELQDDIAGLLNGDTRTALSKLSKLTGRDPIELYKEWGQLIATDGRAIREKSQREQQEKQATEERKRLERLENEAKAREAREQNAQVYRQVFGTLTQTVESDAFPNLSAYARSERATEAGKRMNLTGSQFAARELLHQMDIAHRQGRTLSVHDICSIAEQKLSSVSRQSPTAPDSGPAQAGKTGAGAVPGAEQAVDATRPGTSLSPSAATVNTGATRAMTEEEADREAAKLLDGAFAGLM